MKRVLSLIILAGLVGIIIGLINLKIHRPRSQRIAEWAANDEDFALVANTIQTSCADCHTMETAMPYYSKIPGAKQLVEWDINTGRALFDLTANIPDPGMKPSEVTLARIEWAINNGDMPPLRYSAMHWNSFITPGKKKSIDEWITKSRKKFFSTGDASPEYESHAIQPIPLEVDVDGNKAALGEKLFNDRRLSADNSIACSSCHSLDLGGTDHSKTSTGINDQIGPVNAPTVLNSGFQFAQFWDGRAATLEEQAAGPVLNPIEMGANWDLVLANLNTGDAFASEFKKVYKDGFSPENITSAIAEFERTLFTPNSKFDRYLRGNKSSLNEKEVAGFELFNNLGCATCHVGKIMGGQSYERMGRYQDYFASKKNVIQQDYGRFNVTKEESDRFKFKVPTLRNIAITHPYYHDGSVENLSEAVELMMIYQSDHQPEVGEVDNITAFLNTLTGELQ